MHNLEGFSEKTFSRRDFLKIGAAVTGAAALESAIPKIASAFEGNDDPLPHYNVPPWRPAYWYSEARLDGQPALADPEIDGYVNGLRFHDYLAGTLDLSQRQGSAFAFEQWYNDVMLRFFPQEIGWLGKCAPSQMAAMLDEEPAEKSFYIDGLGWVGRPTMESLYTAYRQGTPTVPFKGQSFHDNLASWLKDGRPALANRAVGTGEKWYSAVWGYNNGYANYYLNGRRQSINIYTLTEAYVVYDHGSPFRDQGLVLAESSKSWANPNLKHQIVKEAEYLYKSS